MSDSDRLSRRLFLRRSLLASAAATVACTDKAPEATAPAACATPDAAGSVDAQAPPMSPRLAPEQAVEAAKNFDFTRGSAALQPTRTVRSACQFCNALCGLDVDVKRGRAIAIRGIEADPVQAGELCVKAELMAEIAHSRERLTEPLVRVAGEKGSAESRFESTTWDDALERIARRFLALRDAGRAHTIANRTTGRMLRGVGDLVARFFTLLGSPNNTDVGPVCNDAGGNALATTLGLPHFTNGYGTDPATGQPDLGSAKLLLFLGTNQAETHPVTFAHLLRHRARTGARLIVIDPRKTPTAELADTWLAPRPTTDLALVLGMIGHIIATRQTDDAFITQHVTGFDALKDHITRNGYTPEWAARMTDLSADAIRNTADAYAQARPAALFCNAGISHQLSAFDTYRALTFLAAITGNIGVPGGGCNFMHNTWPGSLGLPPLPDGFTPANTQPALPVGPDSFARSILDNAPYALEALVTQGNPLLASAGTERVRAAYRKLPFYVYTGLFMEESARYADIILPVTSGLETEGVYMRRDDRAIRWQHAAIPRRGQSRTDAEIWLDLARTMARLDTSSTPWAKAFPEAWRDYGTLWDTFVAHTPSAAGMTRARLQSRDTPLQWPCPDVDHPGVSTLYRDHPDWSAVARVLKPDLKGRFLTPSGRVEITTPELDARLQAAGHNALPIFYAHPEVRAELPTLRYLDAHVANPLHPGAITPRVELGVNQPMLHPDFPLMGMTGRSSVVHFAGVTHFTSTGKRLDGERFVQLHPEAAARAGISDGDAVLVESPRGAVRAVALLWTDIRPDTVFLANGFGPSQNLGEERYEEAANALLDARFFDNLSGQQAYKCFACRVRKA